MNRAPRLQAVALAAIAVIAGLIAAPRHGAAQTPAEINLAADSLPQPTGPSGNPQGVASLTSHFQTFTRYVPLRENWTTINLGTKYAKAVVGGLEQGASLGLGLQFTTADLWPIELRATAITSSKLYRRGQAEAYIPKLFSEHTHADFWFDYLRRTKDNFFGIGPHTPTTSETNYDIERRSYNAALYHNFTREAVAGGYASFSNSATYKGQVTSELPIDQLFSGDPNTIPVSRWVPGLRVNTRILSYGGFAELDYRNNSRGLTRGGFFYGRVGRAEAIAYDTVFSDYEWLDSEMDARGYIPLGSDKTSLALRAYAALREPHGDSQIPFYDQAYLGGRMYGRGFEDYRYRANNLALGSVELRQTVWPQREDRGLDIFGFGDAGQVWGDNRSHTDPVILANQDFNWQVWKTSIGGGLQYRYSKSLAGRVELGHSNQRNLVYVSISRGF